MPKLPSAGKTRRVVDKLKIFAIIINMILKSSQIGPFDRLYCCKWIGLSSNKRE